MMTSKSSPIVAIFLLLSFSLYIGANARFKVNPKTNFFEDEFGRVVIFHGVNAVEKIFPWHPDPINFSPKRSLNAEDAKNLHEWGFNFVRLGTMWPGLEAQRGTYNMTYLKNIELIVNTLGKHGITTLLDMHQDLLSPYWCGEGVPDWAAIANNLTFTFPRPAVWEDIPKDPKTGYADIKTCLKWVFGVFYLSEAVNAGFQSLYDNQNGIQYSFVNFWRVVASYFKSNPNVIGYELINEPWVGNAFKDINYVINRGYADIHNLKPMYDAVAATIRRVDPNHLIFYEPATIDQIWGTSTGFETGPGGPNYNSTNVYSYHTYCTLSDRDGNPYSEPLCNFIDQYLFDMWVSTYKRLGGGGMMTEWGALSSSPGAMQQIQRIAELADERLQSWAWWQFKDYDDVTTASIGDVESFYDSDGNLQVEKVKALSRTYAPAIVGIPRQMKFNAENSDFALSYNYKQPNSTASVPTVVYMNEDWYYPNGVLVSTTPILNYTVLEKNYLAFWHPSNMEKGTEITIKLMQATEEQRYVAKQKDSKLPSGVKWMTTKSP